MKALATSLLIFIILSGLVSYIFKASFAVAPGIVAVACLAGIVINSDNISRLEIGINTVILVSILISLVIASHFYPSITETGLYNIRIL